MHEASRGGWDRWLFHMVWIWLAFRTLLPWLVTFRLTLEGDSYSWGSSYFGHMFHSSGLARPDVLLVFAMLAAGIALLLGLRRHRFRLFAPLTVAYLAIFAANSVYQLVTGDPVIFRGDTLDLTINLTVVSLLLNVGMFLVAALWWFSVRDVPQGPGSGSLGAVRSRLFKAALAIIPVQIILLVVGEPHALTDEIGVLLTMANWVLLCFVFYPSGRYRSGGTG